jgi:hypothetical protein
MCRVSSCTKLAFRFKFIKSITKFNQQNKILNIVDIRVNVEGGGKFGHFEYAQIFCIFVLSSTRGIEWYIEHYPTAAPSDYSVPLNIHMP